MEYLALYDDFDNLLNEKVLRSQKLNIDDGKYFRIVIIFRENSNHEFLIQKCSEEKDNVFATTGGHVQYNVSSIKTAQQEILEELGINVVLDELKLIKTYKYPKAYQDVYYLKKDININDLKLQLEEVSYVEWMSIDKIEQLIKNNLFRKGNIKPFLDLLNR